MKNKKTMTAILVVTIGLLFSGCGASQSATEKAQQAQFLSEQIKSFNFEFVATYAYPQNFRPIYLSSPYDVKVSPDTVQAYLPYYGRAFSAPMDPSEGGIKFTSTDFKYEIEKGRKAGNWIIKIITADTNRPFELNFNLWDNGIGSLNVQDRDRQSISFQGSVEAQKKPK